MMESFVFNNTISPNRQYYFRYKEAYSINPSCFACKIALFSNFDDSLIYYNPNCYAHELNDPEEIRAAKLGIDVKDINHPLHSKLLIATWSVQGNMFYMLEYIPASSEFERSQYNNLFINLNEKYLVRAKMDEIEDSVITSLKIQRENFDEKEVTGTLKSLNLFRPESLVGIQKPLTYFTRNFLRSNKWYM